MHFDLIRRAALLAIVPPLFVSSAAALQGHDEVQRSFARAGADLTPIDVSTWPAELGSVPSGADIWQLALTEDGQGVAYVAVRDGDFYVGWGHGEAGPFDAAGIVACGAIRGAVLFSAQRGDELVLITPAGERSVPGLVGAGFIHGTTDLLLLESVEGQLLGEVAGRPIGPSTSLQPGQAGYPLLDSEGKAWTWRERLPDGRYLVHIGPQVTPVAEWISDPVVLPMSTGDLVSFRMWDGESTMAVVGGDAFPVAWARDPVVSPDGEHFAMAVCLDGRPVDGFEQVREQQQLDARENGYTTLEAFVTSQANMIVDGQLAGANTAYSGDPVFSDDGSRWAYRTRDADGSWSVHRGHPGRVTAGPRFDDVDRPVIDPSGERVVHSSRADGNELLTCDSRSAHAPWNARLHSSESGWAWTEMDGDDQLVIVASPSFDDVASRARYPQLKLFGFTPDGQGPVARVRDDDGWKLWVGGVLGQAYDWILPPVMNATGQVGYVARVEDGYLPVIYDIESRTEYHLTSGDDEPFDAIGAPVVGSDGSISFEVAAEAFVFPLLDDDYPEPTSGPARVLTRLDGEWSKGPEVEDVVEILVGAEGRLTQVASDGERYRVDLFVNHETSEGEWYAGLGEIQLRSDGTPVYVGVDDQGRRSVVIGDVAGALLDDVRDLALDPTGSTVAHVGTGPAGDERAYVDNVAVMDAGRPVGDWLWSNDGRYLAFRAVRGGDTAQGDAAMGGVEQVVIVDVTTPLSARIVEADAVFLVRLTADGRGLDVAVLHGGTLERITLTF